jgi:hypothetical protein
MYHVITPVTLAPPYAFVKGSIDYCQKTVAVDLQPYYKAKPISFSLHARLKCSADTASKALVSKLYAYRPNHRFTKFGSTIVSLYLAGQFHTF